MTIYEKLLIRGSEIFLYPNEEYPASEIISGVNVYYGNKEKTMYAIDGNTYRGFHRIDRLLIGPKKITETFINSKLSWIIDYLKTVQDKQEYDNLCMTITEELREELKKNVKHPMLKPYNKVRKLVDLLFEHLVSMASELREYRKSLVPYLAVPLDSHILKSDVIFKPDLKSSLGIKRRATYKDISDPEQYNDIQDFLRQKAMEISKTYNQDFYPIYFDLLWNNRYEKDGGNLFKTNPYSKIKCKENRCH
ncbi:MAG TPA: hypothetical protein GXX36_14680 [Clostridiaceae bacterium]|nr:hypothetical protein [Clostridiaceae bacterium]